MGNGSTGPPSVEALTEIVRSVPLDMLRRALQWPAWPPTRLVSPRVLQVRKKVVDALIGDPPIVGGFSLANDAMPFQVLDCPFEPNDGATIDSLAAELGPVIATLYSALDHLRAVCVAGGRDLFWVPK